MMRVTLGWRLAWGSGLALLGCGSGEPPRELKLEAPELVTSQDPAVIRARAIQPDGTAREVGAETTYRVSPPELASVGKGGVLVCRRSGEGSVSGTFVGVEGRAKLSCKLAARLEGPQRLKLDVATGDTDPGLSVLDAAGKQLDLPISVISDRASVVQARGGRLFPVSVGTAKLTARAGQVSRQIEVEVVRTLKPEPLPIDQNRRMSYSLDAGKYRLTVLLSSPKRLTVDWLGAPYCAYRGEAAEHRAECTLQSKGSVSFDNPAFLLRGDKTPSVDGVTLQEVP